MASSNSGTPRRRRGGRLRGVVLRVPRGLRIGVAVLAVIGGMATLGVLSYWWVTFGRQIDARLHGERDRVLPRVYARPLELYRGQALGDHQLVDRLNDLGYAQRARIEKPGEFAIGRGTIVVLPRDGTATGRLVRVNFQQPLPATKSGLPAPAVLRVSGLEVLKILKSHAVYRSIPVVVLTSSAASRDVETAYELGANSYIVKPVDFDKFTQVAAQIELYWTVINQSPP